MRVSPYLKLPFLLPLALACLLNGTRAIAGAVMTMPDEGWWESYSPRPEYWPAQGLIVKDGLILGYSTWAHPPGSDTPGAAAWNGRDWTRLPSLPRPEFRGWCLWRNGVAAIGRLNSSQFEAAVWRDGVWQQLGASLPGPPLSIVSGDDRLILSAPQGLYEWKDSAWRQLGPPIKLTWSDLLLLHGDPVVMQTGWNIPRRLHGGSWQQLETLPGEPWAKAHPIVIGDRLYAASLRVNGPTGLLQRSRVMRLDGDRWAPVGSEAPGVITRIFDDHGRPGIALVLTDPEISGGIPCYPGLLMKLAGDDWIPASEIVDGTILDVALMEGEPVISGAFTVAGGIVAPGIARMKNGLWRPFGEQRDGGADGYVNALLNFRGELVAAGQFVTIRGRLCSGVARGDGENWQPFGLGMNDAVFALAEFQGDLIAGGEFTKAGDVAAAGIARWDGTAWHPLGEGFDDRVLALAVFRGNLYAGGWFHHSGTTECRGIARWNGAAWVPVSGGMDGIVNAFANYGDALVVGGEFKNAGNTHARYLARYDGAAWSAFPAEVSSNVLALTTWRDRLVAGGMFRRAGAVPAPGVAFWDGIAWNAPTAEANVYGGWAISLGTYREELVVGWARGDIPPESPDNNFTIWDGHGWLVPETVNAGDVRAVAQFGSSLFIGGIFATAGVRPAQNLARWDGTLVAAPLTQAAAFRSGSTAALAWSAAGASNHSGYEIWRESGAQPRVKLGFVAAAADGRYAYSDLAPVADAADYWLHELGPLGGEVWQGPIPLASLPPGVQLRVPTPNPFHAFTALTFTLARSSRIGIGVYDVQGRHVRTLLDETRPAGVYTQEWDGHDDHGAAVVSGFYWLRVDSDAGNAAQRVLFLR